MTTALLYSFTPVALEEAGHDVEPAFGCQRRPAGDRAAGRNLLGQRIGLFTALQHIAGIAQLRQDDQPGAGVGGLGDQFQAGLDIALDLADARLELRTRDLDACRLCHETSPFPSRLRHPRGSSTLTANERRAKGARGKAYPIRKRVQVT